MKRLNSKELRSLNECAYHTMSNDQLDENILGTIGRGIVRAASRAGSVAARTTSAVGRSGLKKSAISTVGRAGKGIRELGQNVADKISDIRTGTTTASSTRAAQRAASAPGAAQRAAAQTKALADRESLIQDALNASRNTPMSASDAARRISAERALAAGKLDDAEMALDLRQPTAASKGAITGKDVLAAGTGALVSNQLQSKGFFSSNLQGLAQDAEATLADNIFGDARRTIRGSSGKISQSIGRPSR
jgi:hypothetical protein